MKRYQSERYIAILMMAAALMAGVHSVEAAPTDPLAASIEQNDAEAALAREEAERQERAARENAGIRPDNIFVPVHQVEIRGNAKLTEADIRDILPELYKDHVSIHKLAQQIQMANESGAVAFHVDFHESPLKGRLDATVLVREDSSQQAAISVSNTGNDYTGDWRTTVSFLDANLSGKLDTLGAAWVTSPDHVGDVQQVAVSYRRSQPKTTGTWNFNASYSRVDLGNVSPDSLRGILDYTAKGSGISAGLHYQQHLSYTAKERDSWDIGVDYQRSNSEYGYTFQSYVPYSEAWRQDYHIATLSLGFQHIDRGAHHVFFWGADVATSLDNAGKSYQEVTPGSANQFTVLHGNLLYQYRTNSNWILGMHLQGQYTRQHLVSLAQIGAGGLRTVRGFEERVISSDYGIVGNLEIYAPELCKGLRLLAFTDFASLANHTNEETFAFGNESIASAGLGLRYANEKSGIGISVDYAKILDDVRNTNLSHRRWNVNCSYRF